MTLTIALTPAEEKRLAAVAQQEGVDPAEAARKLLTGLLPPVSFGQENLRERQLIEEYHRLVRLGRQEPLSETHREQLRQVEEELHTLEAQDEREQAIDRRLQATGDKLDEILSLLRNLPKKDKGQ